MNALGKPFGHAMTLVTFVAFLGGLLVSLIMLGGFAYGGFDSTRFNTAALASFLSTGVLFFGMLGASSPYPLFPVLIIGGAAWLAFAIGRYATGLLLYSHGTPPVATATCLLLALTELAALILSFFKLKQLRNLR